MASRMAQNGYFEHMEHPELDAEMNAFAQLYDGRIMLLNSGLVVVQDTAGHEEGKTLISKDPVRSMKGETGVYYRKGSALLEGFFPVYLKGSNSGNVEENPIIGVLILNASAADLSSLQSRMKEYVTILFVVFLVIFGVASALLANRFTRPLRKFSSDIVYVTENYDASHPVTAYGYQEVREIATALNAMLSRAAATEKSRQEFVSSVSHELKTPLSAIKVLSDALMLDPDAPIEMYREFIADINSEIDREAQIVSDLLTLVKMDKTDGEMHIAQVNINELLEIIMRRLRPLALKRGIGMTLESYRPVLAEVDEVKLSLVFSNLVENAIKYNKEGGHVKVSLNADHRFFFVKVEDNGIGIPEEEQPMIFDRFYRVDKARSRESGGTGLGLSITKHAVLMHKGGIKVQSNPEGGSVFTVRIPLSFVPGFGEEEE